MATRLLCCGDRNWTNEAAVRRELSAYPADTVVIHGACRGADRTAGNVAKSLGFAVVEFPADWARYGNAAGPKRNIQMLQQGRPTEVIAFHEDLNRSKGTKHMVSSASKAGIAVRVVEK